MKHVSNTSNADLRAMNRKLTLVANIKAAIIPVLREKMDLPRKKTATQQPIPARAEGNLAENSVTLLNGMEKRSINQNSKGGLSGYISPFKRGRIKFLLSNISNATWA
jgi:hypothetical protein